MGIKKGGITINTSNVSEIWGRLTQKLLMRPSFLAPTLDELIVEYEKLNSRQWKKRRNLEYSIARRAITDYRWKKLNENNDPLQAS
jgi:hypothetical protein